MPGDRTLSEQKRKQRLNQNTLALNLEETVSHLKPGRTESDQYLTLPWAREHIVRASHWPGSAC